MFKEKITLREKMLKNIMHSEVGYLKKIVSTALKEPVKIYNARLENYNSIHYINIIARTCKKKIRYHIILTICDCEIDKENAINGFVRRICNCDEKKYPSTIYHLIILSKYYSSIDNFLNTYSINLYRNENKNNLFFTELNLSKKENKVDEYLNNVLSNL